MSTIEPTTRVVTDDGSDPGPGQRLREAREAAQLSVAEVASRLRLDEKAIRLLELDQYDELHGPTFVRGYLRGYARLLDLPERPIMEAYERRGFGLPALVADIARKPQVRVSDFPVRMATYLIAALLVVLVVLWWQSRQAPIISGEESVAAMGEEATAPATADSAATVAEAVSETEPAAALPADEAESPAPSEPSPAGVASAAMAISEPSSDSPSGVVDGGSAVEIVDGPTVSVESSLPEAGSSDREQDPASETTASAMPSQSDQNLPVLAPLDATPEAPGALPLDDSPGASSTRSEPLASDEALDTADEQALTPRPPPLPGSDVLRMQFSRQSWVEVYDRDGGRLYYSLAPEGSEILVRGAGPMEILLGDVEGASVAYNGEPHDMAPYRGRGVVRFAVGEGSASTTPESAITPGVQGPPTLEQPSASDPVQVPTPSPAPALEPSPTPAPDLQANDDGVPIETPRAVEAPSSTAIVESSPEPPSVDGDDASTLGTLPQPGISTPDS